MKTRRINRMKDDPLTQETVHRIEVSPEAAGERLDKVLSDAVHDRSRTALNRFVKEGCVRVNGNVTTKPGVPVSEGDLIEAYIPAPQELQTAKPVDIPLDILYEDDDVLVVNKPKGMVVHPAAGHTEDTLVNAVLHHAGDSLSGIGGVLRPGIVHRIDKDTTGALLVCKNDAAHLSLSAQLKAHTIEREYTALVTGILKEDTRTIDCPLARDTKNRKRMAVAQPGKGKQAVTHVRVLQRFLQDRLTLVSCRLETGRTHQIRVHLTHIGHPLLGDLVYQPRQKSRFHDLQGQCLHAGVLGFDHPVSGKRIRVEAPLPQYFEEILASLR